MAMTAKLRKFALTLHIILSIGWLGAVLTYLALDLTAVTGRDIQTVRAAYLAMELTIWYTIVPLAFGSVLIGIVNALGTPWGLFRRYWVIVKLLLTLFATTILVLETQTIGFLAEAAAASDDPRGLPGSLLHSIGGLLVLIVVTILAVYKPRGMTKYGWRKRYEDPSAQP